MIRNSRWLLVVGIVLGVLGVVLASGAIGAAFGETTQHQTELTHHADCQFPGDEYGPDSHDHAGDGAHHNHAAGDYHDHAAGGHHGHAAGGHHGHAAVGHHGHAGGNHHSHADTD